jgi:twitching motility protein PilU
MSVAVKAIVSQRLVRSKRGGRVPSVEVLMNTRHIADLIERGDVQGIKEAMEQSLAPESISFEQSLYTLIKADQITREDALAAADSQNNLLWFINNSGKPQTQAERKQRAESGADASFSEFTLNI